MNSDLLQPGVLFHSKGDRYRGRISGRILKVNRVNITYIAEYMTGSMILTVRKDDLKDATFASEWPVCSLPSESTEAADARRWNTA